MLGFFSIPLPVSQGMRIDTAFVPKPSSLFVHFHSSFLLVLQALDQKVVTSDLFWFVHFFRHTQWTAGSTASFLSYCSSKWSPSEPLCQLLPAIWLVGWEGCGLENLLSSYKVIFEFLLFYGMKICLGVSEKTLIFKQARKQINKNYISFQARSISFFPCPVKE